MFLPTVCRLWTVVYLLANIVKFKIEPSKRRVRAVDRQLRSFLVLVLLSCLASACASASTGVGTEQETGMSPQSVFSLVMGQGLTCEAQGQILAFSEAERLEFAEILRLADLTVEERQAMADNRETACPPPESKAQGEIGSVSQAISGTYVVVFIPEGTTSGNYASSVFRDSSSSSWMCNSGSPESPADFVVQFHLQGAYYNRNQLELQGQNWWGSCYLNSTSASRVYNDDDVRSCIGYWTVVLCGGTPPLTSDIVLGL